jgi:hypothetical protein
LPAIIPLRGFYQPLPSRHEEKIFGFFIVPPIRKILCFTRIRVVENQFFKKSDTHDLEMFKKKDCQPKMIVLVVEKVSEADI